MATLVSPIAGESGFVLRMPDHLRMSEDDFFDFCAANRDLRIERTAEGDILIMPPAGGETGDANAEITTQLRIWAKRDRTGRTFDSDTGFTLPNGAMRAPDACWILKTRWNGLPKDDRKRFTHICPDFVIELKSPSDTVSSLQTKMEEYIQNGARLGWLIDPDRRRVHVYRPDREVEVLKNPSAVSGDPELPGFTLELAEIWDPDAE
jgi:Uma2 family endonuclease